MIHLQDYGQSKSMLTFCRTTPRNQLGIHSVAGTDSVPGRGRPGVADAHALAQKFKLASRQAQTPGIHVMVFKIAFMLYSKYSFSS
jgi:hypothetical protein